MVYVRGECYVVAMPHSRLKQCCCCSVRKGSIFLAVVGIAFGLGLVTLGSVLVSHAVAVPGSWLQLYQQQDDDAVARFPYEGLLGWCQNNLDTLLIVVIAFGAVMLVVNVLLLVGVLRREQRLMRPWIWFVLTFAALTSLAAAYALFHSIPVETTSATLTLLIALPALAVSIFNWFCVYSYYRELLDEERQRQLKPPDIYSRSPPPPAAASAAGQRRASIVAPSTAATVEAVCTARKCLNSKKCSTCEAENTLNHKMKEMEEELAQYNLSARDIWGLKYK